MKEIINYQFGLNSFEMCIKANKNYSDWKP